MAPESKFMSHVIEESETEQDPGGLSWVGILSLSHISHLQKKGFSLLGLPWVPNSTFNQERKRMQKQRKSDQETKTVIKAKSWFLLKGCCCCSVAKLCLTLQTHRMQHTRLPYPSLSHGACANSCPLTQWCYPTISSPTSLALNLSQHQGLSQGIYLMISLSSSAGTKAHNQVEGGNFRLSTKSPEPLCYLTHQPIRRESHTL